MKTKSGWVGLLSLLILGVSVSAHAQKEKPKTPSEPEPASAPASEPASQEYTKPEKVYVGAYINDIQNLDIKTHSYELDVYFWFRWQNPELNPAAGMEIINPSELWGHILIPDPSEEGEEPEVLEESGELYKVFRVQGRFSKKLPLYNYPYDKQKLAILFEDTSSTADDIVYVPDTNPIAINPNIQLPGYRIGTPTLRTEIRQYPTSFGDPRLPAGTFENYARGIVEIPIERPALAYSIKLLAPIFCVIICAALMFLLSPTYVDSRVDVGITSLLTVVALQMTFNQDLPDVGYLMLMDKIYILSYLFVIAGLAVVVLTTRMADKNNVEAAVKLHKQSLIGLMSGYGVLSLVLILWAAIEG